MAKPSRQNLAKGVQNDFDALFGARHGERIVSGGFKMLAHDRITVRPQVRRTFPQFEMEELRASIRALHQDGNGIEGSGVLQALLVAPQEGGGYRLIAGEKRFRATQAEGLKEVPCIVVPAVSEGTTRLLQLTENSLRSAPPVLEEALSIRDTMDELKLSLRDMARMLGKSKGYVESRVQLTRMDADIQQMVSARADTLRCARLIQAVPDSNLRRSLIEAVLEEEISEREVQRRIEKANGVPVEASTRVSARADTPTAPFGRHESQTIVQQTHTPSVEATEENTKEATRFAGTTSSNAVTVNPTPPNTISPDTTPLGTVIAKIQSTHSLVTEIENLLQSESLSPKDTSSLRQQITTLEKSLAQLRKRLP